MNDLHYCIQDCECMPFNELNTGISSIKEKQSKWHQIMSFTLINLAMKIKSHEWLNKIVIPKYNLWLRENEGKANQWLK